MRKCRLRRLVLAATVIGVAGLLSLPVFLERTAVENTADNDAAISQVDWINADETYPIPPGSPTPSPSYDGDGTSDPDDQDGDGGDGGDGDGGDGPSGDGASPGSGPTDGGGNGGNGSGGVLGLGLPAQIALSVGLLALAFLALLPGRTMPAELR
ncbi:hypothetical protein K3N28_06680 [Glycomyces sp. TRM65418]|uniref:hypothetical protein n=1 Tax=Glycomyces sp. TRM65418 TaxID=2867006 RepID=UPI001CE4D673|nr:hypothetical protein [Glycomyces sp. TRM65418]MCC3762755.1 hypothetical protein [Glycomyces sp. TRM65418]QZD56786.1 hypothetical protein K3N28_06630 [Glycomyces sp. TRM65418]